MAEVVIRLGDLEVEHMQGSAFAFEADPNVQASRLAVRRLDGLETSDPSVQSMQQGELPGVRLPVDHDGRQNAGDPLDDGTFPQDHHPEDDRLGSSTNLDAGSASPPVNIIVNIRSSDTTSYQASASASNSRRRSGSGQAELLDGLRNGEVVQNKAE